MEEISKDGTVQVDSSQANLINNRHSSTGYTSSKDIALQDKVDKESFTAAPTQGIDNDLGGRSTGRRGSPQPQPQRRPTHPAYS